MAKPAKGTLYHRQIQATDQEIDALAYELSRVTEHQIAVAEQE